MSKTLDQMTQNNWSHGGSAGYARYEFSDDFVDEDGREFEAGPKSYLEVATTISGSVVTVPAYPNFPVTESAVLNNGVTVTCHLLDSNRVKRTTLFEDCRIYTSLPSVISLSQIVLANGASRLLRDTDVWTKEQVIDYVETRPPAQKMTSLVYGVGRLSVPAVSAADPVAVGANDYASGSNKGIAKLSVAPVSATEPIAVGVNDPDYRGNVAPGNYYNVFTYGIEGSAHDGTPPDESVALAEMLDLVHNAGGGVIVFNDRKYRFSGQIVIPNSNEALPRQPSMRLTGMGSSFEGQGGAPSGGTIIDLGSTDAGGKIATRGLGSFTVDNISFVDTDGTTAPFIYTTNTSIFVRDCVFYGSTAAPTTQDAIICGGTNTTPHDGSADAPFQGYGSVIERNYFNRIRRAVYGRTFFNGVVIRDNTVWTQSGGTSSEAAIDIDGGSSVATGNWIGGNLIEMGQYIYGIKLTNASQNTLVANNFFDDAVTNLAYIRFGSNAGFNTVIAGSGADTVPMVSDSTATNTVITGHQDQQTTFVSRVKFLNGNTKIVGDGVGLTTENAAGDQWSQSIASTGTAGKHFSLNFTPNGGSIEGGYQFYRASATDKRLYIGGADRSSVIAQTADLRVQAATGQTLWLGTTGTENVLLVSSAGTSTALPITSTLATGTAPLAVASTTKVTNLNADKVDGADIIRGTVTVNPASINADTVSSQTFALGGAVVGDTVIVNPPAAGLTAGLIVSHVFISAADTLTIVFFNQTASPIDEGSASWTYALIRS